MKAALIMDMSKNCASFRLCNMNLYDMSKSGMYCQLNKNKTFHGKMQRMAGVFDYIKEITYPVCNKSIKVK